ncbi:hypothetical protein RTM1035_05250 [Roseovarius sp. TM1035]|uniref:nucleotidyltransferase domain-containing protein n=1 Tax=Roseovarius sp. TM1035 TaxID=391613 RepID=UPI0001556C17|nr:nucleotidyltransferase [Roseovarius sp. TM1035]AWZ21116.1 Hypothetical protein RAK1035_2408 [Roseovarius sp. AK1035]EDM32997.1 hypothetical protein RTM1035_05250 [Roseovarius sp. TM1035]
MSLDDPILRKIALFTPQDILLADVAVRIQLSPTEYVTATKHYEVMGEWIDRPGSPLQGMVDGFYAQGGFSTGSTIAGHDDRCDYDLDAMAVIKWDHGVDPEHALATLHHAIAGEEGSRYFDKSERKTRCTQVQYTGMHLDVTPSVLLESMEPKTSFIFHSKPSDPAVPRQRLFANPFGLAEWFNARTRADIVFGSYFERESLKYARATALAKADTTPVPDQLPAYKKSRQVICLQLIKRWRNLVYDRRHPKLRLPPSVLLTYYVGLHTGGERSLLDELTHQVNCIITTIESATALARLVYACNPTCEHDVLTDRWPGSLYDQQVFLDELREFARKLDVLKRGVSLEEMRKILEELFGEKPARDAIAALRQQHVRDNDAGTGLYIPGRGAVPALGSLAAPSSAKAIPFSTPFGD